MDMERNEKNEYSWPDNLGDWLSPMSTRLKNALFRSGICTEEELYKAIEVYGSVHISNLGTKCVEELKLHCHRKIIADGTTYVAIRYDNVKVDPESAHSAEPNRDTNMCDESKYSFGDFERGITPTMFANENEKILIGSDMIEEMYDHLMRLYYKRIVTHAEMKRIDKRLRKLITRNLVGIKDKDG